MIIVYDLGSQTAHLIARRIRELGVYSEIVSHQTTSVELAKMDNVEGIILSGGPSSTYDPGSPHLDKKIFNTDLPMLGICYGMQLMGRQLNGKVKPGSEKEFGGIEVTLERNRLFKGISKKQKVWMNHGDQVVKLPPGFKRLGSSRYTQNLAMADDKKQLYAVMFHPEVVHTPAGMTILKNFVFEVCQAKKNWSKSRWLTKEIAKVGKQVGEQKAICALSGGVDSAAAAAIVYQAIGSKLKCVYVDTGLMRLNESQQVIADFKKIFGRSLTVIKAEELFLSGLKGKTDPEKKRKIIGKLFIDVFEKEAKKWGVKFLVQGTIYPDVIESAKSHATADTIKSHHNVGGLPARMKLKLVEPLRDLYKDEVRVVAKKLKLPNSIVWRQPFPGPGLAVRIRGEVTKDRLDRLRLAEAILQEEAAKVTLPAGIWVTEAIYVPLKTTGVKGDGRSFEEMIAIRSVTSLDAMTADWTRLPYDLLAIVSSRIVNEVPGINRVVYDITTKPPATMEWE
jgi:GMP synthase (glutamine-hydrolysing)